MILSDEKSGLVEAVSIKIIVLVKQNQTISPLKKNISILWILVHNYI